MELVALLSNRDDILIPRVKNALKKYTLYPLKTPDELENLNSNVPLDLFIIDAVSYRLSSLSHFLERLDDDTVVMITNDKSESIVQRSMPRSVYDCVSSESIMTELSVVVDRAIEQQRVKSDTNYEGKLQYHLDAFDINNASGTFNEPVNRIDSAASVKNSSHEKPLVKFAAVVTTDCDLQKLFEQFISSLMEIVPVSRISIMLRDCDGFSIRKHFGFDPDLAENLCLGKDSALIGWFEKMKRAMYKRGTYDDSISDDIKSEMDMLQCVVSFPLISKGKLIGIVNINNKATSASFYEEELNMATALCNYLAAAIQDIKLNQRVCYHEAFIQKLLSRSDNGVIAVDNKKQISMINRQATKYLHVKQRDLIGSDSDTLPAPLGDILTDTLSEVRTYNQSQVKIEQFNVNLQVHSFCLFDSQQKSIGAGIVFSPVSSFHKESDDKVVSDKLKTIHDLAAKIAHEIRNPMTSIQTYTQLLNEKSSDDELEKFFLTTVSHSIKKLDNLIDKLAVFSGTQFYSFKSEDINDIILQTADFISKNIPGSYKFFKQLIETKPFAVNVDKKHFIKAVYYLVLNIIDKTPEGTYITMSANMSNEQDQLAEVTLAYGGEDHDNSGNSTSMKPLLDIENLDSELNVPISRKIIEGHNGSLELKCNGSINSFIVKLPVFEEQKDEVSSTVEDESG